MPLALPPSARTAYTLTVFSGLLITQTTRVATRTLVAIPGDMVRDLSRKMHDRCIQNAGPACDHEDCPHLECHPGVHELERRCGKAA